LGKVPADTLWRMFRENQGDAENTLASLPDGVPVQRITAKATPFLAHIEQWKAETEVTGKPLAQAIMAVRKFGDLIHEPVENMSRKHVQQFIAKLREAKRSHGTIRNYLSGIRGYWEWMTAHEIVSGDNPFAGHKQRRVKKPDRTAFTVADVLRLMDESVSDVWLWRLIDIARYSGARRESICGLAVKDIVTVDGIECFHFFDKTDAGDRLVPISSRIKPLIAELVENAENGYLFHGMKANKYGNRSDAVGKRFSALKTRLGFGAELTFHSIRHTVAHLFQDAKIEEFIASDVLGHEKPTLTYGLYGGISEVKVKQEAIEKALVYAAKT
jgi:integrase